MASSDKQFCTLCDDDGTSNAAVRWCTECEVFLCKDCEKHHGKSRMFKNHKTMTTNEYNNLPAFMQDLSSQCSDHKKKLELYCPFHACPCCVQCITDNHKKCQEMKPLSNILKQVNSSASVQLLQKDLNDLQENFNEIRKYLKSREKNINIQKTNAIEEIQSMRKSINDYLNILEKEILYDLESKHSELKSEINTLLEQMEQQANQIGQMLIRFSELTERGNELQLYIGLREIEKITSKASKYKDDLESSDHFQEKNLEVSTMHVRQLILQDVKLFGKIHVRTESSSLILKAGRKDQAQYLAPNVPGIDQINLTFLRKLTIPPNLKSIQIHANVILPDGSFLIVDFNEKCLMVFSEDGIFMRVSVTFSGYPHDACIVRNSTVAVTLGSTNQTVLVDIVKNEVIQTIQLSHHCVKVASDGQIMVINGAEESTTFNLNDMSPTRLGVEAITSSISLFKGNIYGTVEKEVCCYKSDGALLWKFQNYDINNAEGLSIDMNGFIYIASNGNGNIVVVSPEGKTSKTVLTEADGIKSPYAIDIDRERGIMIVSSEIRDDSEAYSYQTAFVYKL